ncbi:hypothetical protein HK102_001596 [Quaeritorhiza haematococci]|nr:hypothetical protein HK102_001596 [Quaeritorhiza haematococci]
MAIEIDFEAVQKVLNVEEKLEKIEEEHSREQAVLAAKFELQKQPTYKKRDEAATAIDGFWKMVVSSHPILTNLFSPEEDKVMEHLTSMSVVRDEKQPMNYKLTFKFSDNEWFTNKELTKEIKWKGKDEFVVENTKIKWKPGKSLGKDDKEESKKRKSDSDDKEQPKKKRNGKAVDEEEDDAELDSDDEGTYESFFAWMQDDAEDTVEIANIIATDVYPTAGRLISALLGGDDDDDDEEDDE